MYDPRELLARIDADAPWILAGFGIAMIFQTIWLVECIRLARRQRAYTMPLFCTLFWFAHDIGCVARFREWFFVYDHWFMKFFWLGLLSAVVLEVIFLVQVVQYGRAELLPWVSQRTFVAGLVAAQLASIITWELFKAIVNDPLYQFSPQLTLISYSFMGAALMLKRRSALGQNTIMWGAYTVMCAVWPITTATFYGEPFRTWQYLAGAAVAFVGGVVMTWLVSSRSPMFNREPVRGAASEPVTAL